MSAWALKTIIGVVSDVRPIFNYRRKPYLILGMGLAFIPLAVITLKPVPEPYYEAIHDEANGTCYVNRTSVNNPGAKEQGLQYVIINALAFLMLSFADVAADGLKVRRSQIYKD